MSTDRSHVDALIDTWRTGQRITAFLVERLPPPLWSAHVPGYPRRTVRMIVGHLHNNRCMWIKLVGGRYGVRAPASVSRFKVTQSELLRALRRSDAAMATLFEAAYREGGSIPGFGLDAVHFVAYHIAHEAHHRGQIVIVARQLGHELPGDATTGLWQWSKRSKEVQ